MDERDEKAQEKKLTKRLERKYALLRKNKIFGCYRKSADFFVGRLGCSITVSFLFWFRKLSSLFCR